MKGISTIIAVILILLITVALAGFAYLYITGYLTGRTSQTFEILGASGNIITIHNLGTENITSVRILVDGSEKNYSLNPPIISPGKIGDIIVYNVSKGYHTITISTRTSSQTIKCLFGTEEIPGCVYHLSISPSSDTYIDTNKAWNISATDSSSSNCSDQITYTISYTTTGTCTQVSIPSSFTISRGSTLPNAFTVNITRGSNVCTVNINIRAPDSSLVATASFSVSPTTDTTPPVITFVPPTPDNASTVNTNWVYINTSITDPSNISTCILQWNTINYTMNKIGTGSNVICWYNVTNLSNGQYTYKVYANDSLGNMGNSSLRTVTISTISWLYVELSQPSTTIEIDNLNITDGKFARIVFMGTPGSYSDARMWINDDTDESNYYTQLLVAVESYFGAYREDIPLGPIPAEDSTIAFMDIALAGGRARLFTIGALSSIPSGPWTYFGQTVYTPTVNRISKITFEALDEPYNTGTKVYVITYSPDKVVELSQPSTTIEIDNLNITDGKFARIVFMGNPTGPYSNARVWINNDMNESNYYTQELLGVEDSVYARRVNYPIGPPSGDDVTIVFSDFGLSGGRIRGFSFGDNNIPENAIAYLAQSIYTPTVNKISKITFQSLGNPYNTGTKVYVISFPY